MWLNVKWWVGGLHHSFGPVGGWRSDLLVEVLWKVLKDCSSCCLHLSRHKVLVGRDLLEVSVCSVFGIRERRDSLNATALSLRPSSVLPNCGNLIIEYLFHAIFAVSLWAFPPGYFLVSCSLLCAATPLQMLLTLFSLSQLFQGSHFLCFSLPLAPPNFLQFPLFLIAKCICLKKVLSLLYLKTLGESSFLDCPVKPWVGQEPLIP